ncbi:MAG: hypothetical protein E6K14_09565 [Methanobacteriota archaeon]|nr:MAG: hypothetical protein E6K14_09565 [Euryarchaeota archaeon]
MPSDSFALNKALSVMTLKESLGPTAPGGPSRASGDTQSGNAEVTMSAATIDTTTAIARAAARTIRVIVPARP